MQIFCYEPRGKFSRVYIAVAEGDDPRATDQDLIWERIKRTHFHIEEGHEAHYWMDDGEEADERAAWFASWHEDRAWEPMGLVAIDSHY